MDPPSTAIGPGLGAFIAFFLLAVLLWFLMRNMNARMRRMAYAERDRVARADAEILAAEAAKEAAERGETSADTATGAALSTDQADPASPAPSAPAPSTPERQEPGAPSA